MAVYGVLADAHGNREALAAGLAALERPRCSNKTMYSLNSRKRAHKLAECAVLDTESWSVESLRLPYDAAATEAKAAAFGYRIPPWTEGWYRVRRRLIDFSRGV